MPADATLRGTTAVTAEQQRGCDCGRPLHYRSRGSRAKVDHLVAELGPCVTIETSDGAWLVPRHYVALHGVTAAGIPELARRFDWPQP